MKALFVLGLSVLATTSAFANSDFTVSKENAVIAAEISSRISSGTYSGRTLDNKLCTVDVRGFEDIVIKTADFKKADPTKPDCLVDDATNIACFEFSPSRYLAQRSWFSNGDLFSAKVIAQTSDTFHLRAKRKLGGDGKYELITVQNSQEKSIEIKENQAQGELKRSLKCILN